MAISKAFKLGRCAKCGGFKKKVFLSVKDRGLLCSCKSQTPEETHTREVEEIIKEFFDLHFRQTEDGKSVYLCMTSTADDVGDWLAETVHHQLQKARRKAKLDGYKFAIQHFRERLEIDQTFADAVTSMEKLTDQAELERGLVDKG